MRAVLDANVLFPTVMREIVLAAARAGFFEPLWSERILKEWELAALRHGPAEVALAQGEIARLRAAFPRATVPPAPGIEARLLLPDPHDIHVLATAIAGSADLIVTSNARDFPRGTLRFEGVDRIDPDALMMGFWLAEPDRLERAVAEVHREAERLSGAEVPIRALLKRARLPRLGKALAATG